MSATATPSPAAPRMAVMLPSVRSGAGWPALTAAATSSNTPRPCHSAVTVTPVAAWYLASAPLRTAACGSDSCHIDQYVHVFASAAAAVADALLEEAARASTATAAA